MKRFLAGFLLPILANAQPAPAIQDLFAEPATLLDVGMVRLELLTGEFEESVGIYWTEEDQIVQTKAEIYPRYDKASKKIQISFHFMTSVPSKEQMLEACENATIQMEHWLRRALPGLFLPAASSDSSKIPEMFRTFEEVILLSCYFSSEQDSADGRFWAFRYLGNREITIGKWEPQD